MEDTINSAIMNVVDGFDSVSTTEDQRKGVERRQQVVKQFPLDDSDGNIIAEDRRVLADRRAKDINIDDIAAYLDEE